MTAKIPAKDNYNRRRLDGRLYETTKNCPCDNCFKRSICEKECTIFEKYVKGNIG